MDENKQEELKNRIKNILMIEFYRDVLKEKRKPKAKKRKEEK